MLGSGAFGVVRKAIAHNIEPDKASTTVAVKSLKGILQANKEIPPWTTLHTCHFLCIESSDSNYPLHTCKCT